ncbi:MAG: hypothetical protein VX347_03705 [Bacteroidota bacterium]|nr:hypothetical protein [Bacteroidota bacterium]
MKNILSVILAYLLLSNCSYKDKSLSNRFMQHFSVELDTKSVDLINYKGGYFSCNETFVIEFNSQEYYKEIFGIIDKNSIWETPNNKKRNIGAIEEGTLWNENCIDCNSKKIKDLKRTNYHGNSINHRAIFYDDNTVEFFFSDCW